MNEQNGIEEALEVLKATGEELNSKESEHSLDKIFEKYDSGEIKTLREYVTVAVYKMFEVAMIKTIERHGKIMTSGGKSALLSIVLNGALDHSLDKIKHLQKDNQKELINKLFNRLATEKIDDNEYVLDYDKDIYFSCPYYWNEGVINKTLIEKVAKFFKENKDEYQVDWNEEDLEYLRVREEILTLEEMFAAMKPK